MHSRSSATRHAPSCSGQGLRLSVQAELVCAGWSHLSLSFSVFVSTAAHEPAQTCKAVTSCWCSAWRPG